MYLRVCKAFKAAVTSSRTDVLSSDLTCDVVLGKFAGTVGEVVAAFVIGNVVAAFVIGNVAGAVGDVIAAFVIVDFAGAVGDVIDALVIDDDDSLTTGVFSSDA